MDALVTLPDISTDPVPLVTDAPFDGSRLNLAELIAATRSDLSITTKARSDEASALGRLATTLDRPADQIELLTDEHQFERLLRHLDKLGKPTKGPNLRNIRSRCRRAFRRFIHLHGIVPQPKPAVDAPWPTAWQEVADAFPKSTGFSPRRFIAYAVSHGWSPEEICDDSIARYRLSLDDLKHPRPHLRRLIKGWNEVASQSVRQISKLTPLANGATIYRVPIERLHPDLQVDIAAYFSRRSESRRRSIHDEIAVPRLRPESVAKSQRLLCQFLGLLQRDGIAVGNFRTLAEVVTFDHVDLVTAAELDRSEGRITSQLRNMLTTVCAIAHWWVKPGHATLKTLQRWTVEHTPQYTGMTARNRGRLLMLKDRRHFWSLLSLPDRLMAEASRMESERGAYLAQYAIAIELLLQTAIRIKNLAGLRLKENVITTGTGKASKVFIMLEPDEVKNREPVRIELPDTAAAMLNTYLTTYRPRLRNTEGTALFPGRDGRSKGAASLGPQISAVIKHHTGLDIHPHLFRAIAVFTYLRHHPGDLATVQRILGDRQLTVVLKHYAFLDDIAVRASYQQSIAADRHSLRATTSIRGGKQ